MYLLIVISIPVDIIFTYRNILTSSKRTHPFIIDLNYGLITIHWDEEPVSMVAFMLVW